MVKGGAEQFNRITVGSISITILLYLAYCFTSSPENGHGRIVKREADIGKTLTQTSGEALDNNFTDPEILRKVRNIASDQCQLVRPAQTDINTVEQLPKFNFQPTWMNSTEFWDVWFEERYQQARKLWSSDSPLTVIVVPYSHNDPGWLKTFEQYYWDQTSKILSNMVEKLQHLPNMTFIWTEVSFLSFWYDRAEPEAREQLKELIKSGRVEITTGGWVMTDEANVDLYAMVAQLIEGHQWLYNKLGVRPVSGWSIDPFGHSATVPYLLKESGIDFTVIQRIHFAWKQWLAKTQSDDFLWRQIWDTTGETDILTHSTPYNHYNIKHSCGPHTEICLNFDFRKIDGQYTEYSKKAVEIDDNNVKEKGELLLEEYGRTGSLFPHNVVLVPLGDDFRYDHEVEWDQQYRNYQRLMDWMNGHPDYHVNMRWGTLKDYHNEVKKRLKSFPTLKGDFFVYSDIFATGRPAYWSGYFTTRPYWKVLTRQLQSFLHVAEFLYTWAWSLNLSSDSKRITQILEKDFEGLVKARRHLALFQHHDGVTGTSKSYVMKDYGIKLNEGIQKASLVISHAAFALLATEDTQKNLREGDPHEYLQHNFERSSYENLPKQLPIQLRESQRVIVLTNSLAQRRYEVVKIIVNSLNLKITDEHGNNVPFQVNPVWNASSDGIILRSQFEVFFIADLAPTSLVTFTLHETAEEVPKSSLAIVYSNFYGSHARHGEGSNANKDHKRTIFEVNELRLGNIKIENEALKLFFDDSTGLLESVMDKRTGRTTRISLRYGAYRSTEFYSGAYLFKPNLSSGLTGDDVLAGTKPRIFIQSGLIASEVTVMFGKVLKHSFRIFHVAHTLLATAIYMENYFNLGDAYNATETPGFSSQFQETELFFRISTDIDNGQDSRLFTDQNGLGMQERTKVERIGIQGNYYPVTTAAYIEDEASISNRRRVTLLVDHAAGVASWKTGYLEAMVERRMFYDDARGMGEGVTDQKRTLGRYWLLMEDLQDVYGRDVPRLSFGAHYLSNSLKFPPILLVLEGLNPDVLRSSTHFLTRPFPCSLHLLLMRTLADPQYPGMLPGNEALMVMQHQPFSCHTVSTIVHSCSLNGTFDSETNFTIPVSSLRETTLTGVKEKRSLKSLADLQVPYHRLRSFVVTF